MNIFRYINAIQVTCFTMVAWSGLAYAGLDHAAIIKRVSEAYEKHYVFPDVAKKMSMQLQAKLKNKAYDKVNDPEAFAELLTEDLISVSNDRHIRIQFSATEPDRMGEDPDMLQRIEQQMKNNNYEFKKVEILDGNIGYLKLDGFAPAEFAGSTAVAAMKFLNHTDALIIDLRYNGGGAPSMIQLLSSYFFERPTHLNSFYVRASDQMDQFWTNAHVDGERYLKKEIFVLTSGGTFSAAEEFSYNLKHLKRATLVGEVTGGGAHPVDTHYLADVKLAVTIPFGRAINPITKTNWEGVGVKPHVATPAMSALDKAHELALKNLIKNEKGQDKKAFLKWSMETIQSRTNPIALTKQQQVEYVGSYGERKVTLEKGQLFYQRGKSRSKMVAVAKDRFAVAGIDYFRLQFNRDRKGRLVSVSGIYQNGRRDKSIREN